MHQPIDGVAHVPSTVVRRPARLAFIGRTVPTPAGTPQALGSSQPTWGQDLGRCLSVPAAALR